MTWGPEKGAYINVAEWSCENVTDWLRGLDECILPYVGFFLNNNVNGCRLLLLTSDDLENLNVHKKGHQELILEGVDLLKQLHYNFSSETLQSLALKLGCKARSLFNQLKADAGQERLSTNTLSCVSEILNSVKTFISWIDRYPFCNQGEFYQPIRATILLRSIELASTSQRDQFVQDPNSVIKAACLSLADLCDRIVTDLNDSLTITPATLEVVGIKKRKDEDIGLHIYSSYTGIHMVGAIKDPSPSHRCGRIEEGDEIIQVRYQTVVGWQLKNLVSFMKDSPTEILLTLKKRPRHSPVPGQMIVVKPQKLRTRSYNRNSSTMSRVKSSTGSSATGGVGAAAVAAITAAASSVASATGGGVHASSHPVTSQMPYTPEALSLAGTGAVSTPESDEETFESSYKQTQLKGPVHPMHQPKKSRNSVRRRATISGSSPTMIQPPIRIEDLVPNSVKGSVSSGLGCKKDLARSASQDTRDIYSSDKSSRGGCGGKTSSSSLAQVPSLPPPPPLPFASVGATSGNSVPSIGDSNSQLHPPAVTSCSVPYAKVTPLPAQSTPVTTSAATTVPKQVAYIRRHSDHPPKVTHTDATYGTHCHSKQESNHPVKPVTGSQVGVVIPSHTLISSFPSPAGSNPDNHHYYSVQSCHTHNSSSSSTYSPKKLVAVTDCIKQSRRGDIPPPIPQRSGAVACKSSSGKGSTVTSKSTSCRVNRCVPCKSLGSLEYQGWLLQLKETKGFIAPKTKWLRRWVILKQSYLYCYKSSEATKADCLINLPGFVVAPATECRAKKYVFKVYSLSHSFQFAAETVADMSKWISKIGFAAISYSTMAKTVDEAFYTESDASESELSYESPTHNHHHHHQRKQSQTEYKSKYKYTRDVSPHSSSSSSSDSSHLQNLSSKTRHQRASSRDAATSTSATTVVVAAAINRQNSFTSGSSTSRSSECRVSGHQASSSVKSTRVTNAPTSDVSNNQPAFGQSVSCLTSSSLTRSPSHKQQQQQSVEMRHEASQHRSSVESSDGPSCQSDGATRGNYVKLSYPPPSTTGGKVPPPVPSRYAELESVSPAFPPRPPHTSVSTFNTGTSSQDKPKLPEKPCTLSRREPPTPIPRVSKLKSKAQTPPPPDTVDVKDNSSLVKPLIVGAKAKKLQQTHVSHGDTQIGVQRSSDTDLLLNPIYNHVIPNEHGKRLAVAVDPNIFTAKSPTENSSSSHISMLDREYNRLFGDKSPNELNQCIAPRSAINTTEVVADLYGMKIPHGKNSVSRTFSESDSGHLRSQSPISDHSVSSSSGISSSNNSTYIDSVALLQSTNCGSSIDDKNNLTHRQIYHSQDYLNQSETSVTSKGAGNKPVKSSSFRLFHSPKLLKKFSSPKYHKVRRLEKKDSKSPAPVDTSASGASVDCTTPKTDGNFFNFNNLTNGNRKSTTSVTSETNDTAVPSNRTSIGSNNGVTCSPNTGGNVSDSSVSDKSRTSLSASSLCKVQRSESGDWSTVAAGSSPSDAPKKPTMGVTMIKKKRASNVSTDKVAIETALLLHQQGLKRSASSLKSECNEYPSCNSPDTEEEWSHIVEALQRVGVSVDKSIKSKINHTRTSSTPTTGTN